MGSHKRVWDACEVENGVVFTLDMPDGDMGFPGNKKLQVTYTVNEENELKLESVSYTHLDVYKRQL